MKHFAIHSWYRPFQFELFVFDPAMYLNEFVDREIETGIDDGANYWNRQPTVACSTLQVGVNWIAANLENYGVQNGFFFDAARFL